MFTPICTQCHIGAGAPVGLQLDAQNAFSKLVGVPSVEKSGVLRVAPGNPSQSYLIQKLEGAPGIVGGRMPLGGPFLPQATIDVIAQWISNGAPQSSDGEPAVLSASAHIAQLPADLLVMTSTSPPAGALMPAPLSHIVLAFNHEVDLTRVNDATVQLRAWPVHGATIPVTFGVVQGNPAAILVSPKQPLTKGTYQVTVRGGANGIGDLGSRQMVRDQSFVFAVEGGQ